MRSEASVSARDFATTLPKPATPRQTQYNKLIVWQIILLFTPFQYALLRVKQPNIAPQPDSWLRFRGLPSTGAVSKCCTN